METGNGILLEILSTLDEKGFRDAQAELAKIGITAKKTGEDGRVSLEKMEKAATKSKTSFTDLAAKVMVAYASVTKLVGAWTTQAKADKQLELSIRNNTDNISRQGQTVQQLTDEFKRFAQAREASTNIDDAETQRLQMMLLSMKELPQNVNKVVSAFQDMSAGTGKGVTELLNVWKKVSDAGVANESVMASLREAGVRLNESELAGLNLQQRKEKVLSAITAQYGGQAESIAQAEGATGKFSVSIGNLLESMGKLLADAIGPTISGLSKLFDWFTGLPGVVKIAIIGLVALGSVFVSATVAGTSLSVAIRDIFTALGPVGWAITAIAALGTAIGALAKTDAEKSAEMLKDLADASEQARQKMSGIGKDLGDTGKLNEFVGRLSKMKEGTDAYKAALSEIMRLDPLMAASLKNTNASFKQVQASLTQVTYQYKKAAAERAQIIVNDLASQYNQAALLLRSRPWDTQLQAQVLDLSKTLGLALGNYLRIAYGKEAKNWIINEGQQVVDAVAEANKNQKWKAGDLAKQLQNQNAQKAGKPLPYPELAAQLAQGKVPVEVDNAIRTILDKIDAQFGPHIIRAINSGIIEAGRAGEVPPIEIPITTGSAVQDAQAEVKGAVDSTVDDINAIGGAVQAAFDIGTQIIKKDWMGAVSSFLGAVPGIGSMLQGVFGSAVAFFDALITTSAEAMEEKMSKAIDKAKARANAASRISDIEDTDDNTKALQARRDALRASIEQAKRDLKLTKDYSQEEWAEVLTAIEQDGLDGLKRISATNQLAKDLRGKGVTDRVNYLKGISSDLWAWINDLEDLEPKAVVSGYMDEIQRIQDLVDTGRMSEEEARQRQLEQYDRAIAALKGVAGAERLILELEKEKYNLLKAQNGEADKALLTAKQRQILSDIEKIDYEVKTGVRQDGYQTAQEKQRLYSQLLSSMADSGLYDSEIYRKYNLQMSDMVKGYIGQDVFSALSGRGGAVTLPTASNMLYVPGSSTSVSNSTNNVTNVSANLNLPPDLVQWLIRQVQTGAGRTLLS